ncbi:MAG: HYR domain-containing protein, partial [Flavobacterium sp.]|nr:HYR domain-containing protein [Flavobacterium sp.]
MKKKYLIIIILFFSYSLGYSQNDGDFQSKAVGSSIWNDASTWQIYSSGVWTNAANYPGEITGTYTVTIQATHTITIPSDLSTNSMGTVLINGTLVLGDGTSNQHITTLSTKLLTINPNGKLTFSGPKVRLILPAPDAVLIIEPSGAIDGSCTNNDEIFVDTSKYATCVGSGSTTYSFGDLIAAGGTVNAKITSHTTNPVTVSGCTLINLTGGYSGTENNVTYVWKARDPNGVTTTINSGSLADNTIPTSTSYTPNLPGEFLVSLEVTTASFATNVETRTFNVVDTTNPTIICPANITVNNTPGTCGAAVTYTAPVGTDNCSGATTTQTAGFASGATFPVGVTTNTFMVTDAAGLTASCSFTVTVIDNQVPTIATLTAISVNSDAGVCTYDSSQLTEPTASDNCTTVTVTRSPASLVKGPNTVTWTATDAAGLMASSTQTVTVVDTQAPTIATLTAISVNADAGVCTYDSSQLTAPTASDNCTTVTVTRSPASLVKGSNTVTWTATDAAGLTASS